MSLDDQRAEIEFRGVEIKAEDSTLWQQGKAGVIGVNKKKKKSAGESQDPGTDKST